MNLMPEDLPDDPILLKQMLLEALSRQQVYVRSLTPSTTSG